MAYVIKIPVNELSQGVFNKLKNMQIDAGTIHNFLKSRGQRILEEADTTKPKEQHVKALDDQNNSCGNGVTVHINKNNSAEIWVTLDEPIAPGLRKSKADILSEVNLI